MSTNKIKEDKKHTMKGQEGKQRALQYKTFKSKVKDLKDAAFDSGAVNHAPIHQDERRHRQLSPNQIQQ